MIARRQALALVLDALRPDGGGEAGAERRRRSDAWAGALALANAHYVVPAMHAALSAGGRLAELPADVAAYLAHLHGCNVARNAALRAQADELVAALNRKGLRPVLLKGAVGLYADPYRDPGARMNRDIDVLLPASAAPAALGVLEALDYRPQALYPAGHHAYGDFVRPGAPGAVDLHFELVDCAHLLPARELVAEAVAVDQDGLDVALPSPMHRVLHHLLHAQIHHLGKYYRGVLELRQLHEFATLMRRCGGAVDGAAIARRLERWRLGTAFEAYRLSACRLLGWDDGAAATWSAAARLQHARSVLMLLYPGLEAAILPAANLYAAFAAHRMLGLYGEEGRALHRRFAHGRRYLRKATAAAAARRLFKAQ
ncbi:MAG: nucleotidyltransferase family protein [Alphaproteobacteria bacterium]|nr:nucleotidyltransferase family protein [Alphaproteobacteria bacterium]